MAGLVYIAALAPDADETSQSQQAQFPVTDVFSHIEVPDGRVWMKPEGVECFAGHLSDEEQRLVWATHAAPAASLFNQRVDGTAWGSKPSLYIVAINDRFVQPELQHFVAKRMGVTTVETSSRHVAMLSQPALVLDVIRKAASLVHNAWAFSCSNAQGKGFSGVENDLCVGLKTSMLFGDARQSPTDFALQVKVA